MTGALSAPKGQGRHYALENSELTRPKRIHHHIVTSRTDESDMLVKIATCDHNPCCRIEYLDGGVQEPIQIHARRNQHLDAWIVSLRKAREGRRRARRPRNRDPEEPVSILDDA